MTLSYCPSQTRNCQPDPHLQVSHMLLADASRMLVQCMVDMYLLQLMSTRKDSFPLAFRWLRSEDQVKHSQQRQKTSRPTHCLNSPPTAKAQGKEQLRLCPVRDAQPFAAVSLSLEPPLPVAMVTAGMCCWQCGARVGLLTHHAGARLSSHVQSNLSCVYLLFVIVSVSLGPA